MKSLPAAKFPQVLTRVIFLLVVLAVVGLSVTTWVMDSYEKLKQHVYVAETSNHQLAGQVASIAAELTALKSQDQRVINQKLERNISQIETTYKQTVVTYEDLLRLREISKKTTSFDEKFAKILTLLSAKDYESASTELAKLKNEISGESDKIKASFVIPDNLVASNTPPGSGFSRQSVTAAGSTFMVDLIAGDLGSTRVIVDTAAASDCKNDCPVLALGDYVSRNGAYAGINGAYFCPSTYPTCADKKNSFDTLLMNKDKHYFNSDNNVYSTVPAVIFLGGSVRFVGRSLDWGRDTGIDSMIANQPLLVSGGNVVFGGDVDPKKGSRGARSFVASRGNTVYIGVVYNATVAESALALKALGMDNGLNLDSGGSTALWFNGYKVGPGRGIPNAILFVKK